jgi:hypothetical protein
VGRDLGDEITVEIAPRWRWSEYLSLGTSFGVRRRSADRYTGRFDVTDDAGAAVTLDASTLDAETEATEQRFGLGATYSTLPAFDRGNAKWPIDVTYQHLQTWRGSGGALSRLSIDVLQFRWYFRPWGGGRVVAAPPVAPPRARR